jgi:hypothetical protein
MVLRNGANGNSKIAMPMMMTENNNNIYNNY